MRLVFTASTEYENINANFGVFEINDYCDIEAYDENGNVIWKNAKELQVGDIIYINDDELNSCSTYTILNIKKNNNKIIIKYNL